MISTAGLAASTMLACAERRALVRLERGNTARLVGWQVRGGRDRARVELRPGVVVTVKCSDVVEVEAPEEIFLSGVDN